MSTPTPIGTAKAGGACTARRIHYGDEPATLVPLRRRIWTHTFDRNTDAMAAALMTRDWSDLTDHPRPGAVMGDRFRQAAR